MFVGKVPSKGLLLVLERLATHAKRRNAQMATTACTRSLTRTPHSDKWSEVWGTCRAAKFEV
jgi:hypothetical protein